VTKTQYFTATSVDGFIADEHHCLDWLLEIPRGDDRFGPFFARVGAFVMGANSYQWMLDHENVLEEPRKWRTWYGEVPCWVFTHRALPHVAGADITFVRGEVRPVHEAMINAAGGKNIWLTGGGELVGTFADHGLLDEVILDVAPVTLGAGAPLLPRRLLSARLRLIDVEQVGRFAHLTYALSNPVTS
jgi:dihydrofolate reductase